jgi:hypothetical protein
MPQLQPRALGSLYATSYSSQGSGGSILTRLHTGLFNYDTLITVYMEVLLWRKLENKIAVVQSFWDGAYRSRAICGCIIIRHLYLIFIYLNAN